MYRSSLPSRLICFTLLLFTMSFLVITPALAKWQKPYTPSGYPEVTINKDDLQTVKNAISNALLNVGFFLTKDEGSILSFESNQVIMGYRPVATINLFNANQEIRVIMRRFGMNPNATRPGTISNYFMLDSTIELTQQKKNFLDSMAFLEGIKAQLEDYGRTPIGDDYIPQTGKIEVTKPFAETAFPSKINLD